MHLEKRNLKDRLACTIFWLLLLSWMAFIFYMSAQTADESAESSGRIVNLIIRIVEPDFDKLSPEEQKVIDYNVQFWVRKTAHFVEYVVLGFLMYLVAQAYSLKRWLVFWVSWLLAALYAVSDELHQMFVGGRAAQIRDVCIDSLGALTGVILCTVSVIIVLKIMNKKANNALV